MQSFTESKAGLEFQIIIVLKNNHSNMKQVIPCEIKLYPISFLSYSSSFSCNSMSCSGCPSLHGVKPSFKKCILKNISALLMTPDWSNLILNSACIKGTFHKKANIAWIKQTCNKSSKTNLNSIITHIGNATACVNDCSKVKLDGLVVRPLNHFFGYGFLNHLDQQISDQTNRSKHRTLNY